MKQARGRIPEGFISELIARTDIVSLIESRVKLKRQGREFAACCPFHNEKTPSFTVSPDKQFYHCFGCGAHGNAVGFLMEYDQLEFLDAIEVLAEQAGMQIPREALSSAPRPNLDHYEVLAEAEAFYCGQLKGNQVAIDYLKGRGLSGEIVKRFKIGVAPEGWTHLTDRIGTSRDRLRSLEQAGLIGKRDSGGYYDKFRDRIMFPIHDLRGRPIAFGGRLYRTDEGPKYYNSPETELFHKSNQLYGLYEARQAGAAREQLLVVEGYMDVVALAQHGIDNAVATLGTATTESHIKLLFRNAPEVVFCFDGDRAGRQAADRAMEAALSHLGEGRQVRFLFLPEGEDPDSLVRDRGRDGFQELVAKARSFSECFFDKHQAQVDMSSLDGRARLVELARPEIEKMEAGAFKDMLFERLEQLAKARVSRPSAGNAPRPRVRAPERISLVRSAIQCLVRSPPLAAVRPLPDGLETLERSGIDLLIALHDWCARHPEAHAGQLVQAFAEHEHAQHVARLAAMGLLSDEVDLEAEYSGAIAGLERQVLRLQLASLRQRATSAEDLRELYAIEARLKKLAAEHDRPST